MITEGNFKYYFNNEPKTREEIVRLIDYDTTVSINNLDVHYFSPKKEIKATDLIKEKQEKVYTNKLTLNVFNGDIKPITLSKFNTVKEAIDFLGTIKYTSYVLYNGSDRISWGENKIQQRLKEADKYQAKNGGILQGVEFPFDTVVGKKEREQKVIEDWNKEVNSSSEVHHILSDFTVGKKESEGKLNYELDWEFIQQMAERMGQNKGKYEPYNWQKSMDVEKLKQSLFRHVIEVMKNNYSDDDREFGHLESIALNALFINYQLKNNK